MQSFAIADTVVRNVLSNRARVQSGSEYLLAEMVSEQAVPGASNPDDEVPHQENISPRRWDERPVTIGRRSPAELWCACGTYFI